jgi:colanic acid biosynthesis glycosyl transferase WcaI
MTGAAATRTYRRGAIWIVTELYYPEQTSTGRFLTGIAEGLARTFDVKVICSQPTYSARGVKAPKREVHNGVEIMRCRSTTLNKDLLPLRVVNAVTFGVGTVASALRGIRRGDTVLVVTTPPVLPILLAPVCRLRGARLVVLVHDVYPEVLTASGFAAPGSIMVRAVRRLYDGVFKRAVQVVVLGRDMRDLLLGRVEPERMAIIPNWGDVDRIRPLPKSSNALLGRLGIDDHFVIHYLGNMGRTHDLETLLAAAAELQRSGADFIFTGHGWRRGRLQAEAKRAALSNVHILPGCSEDELCDYLNACDVAVISLNRGMVGVSVPSRLYNVLAAGTPVVAICEAGSELALVVVEHDCGWIIEPGDVTGLLRALHEARADAHELARMGERARAAAVSLYNEESVITLYDQLFRRIMPHCASGFTADREASCG